VQYPKTESRKALLYVTKDEKDENIMQGQLYFMGHQMTENHHTCTAITLYQKFKTNIPRNETAHFLGIYKSVLVCSVGVGGANSCSSLRRSSELQLGKTASP
jgi:hypothetical protein